MSESFIPMIITLVAVEILRTQNSELITHNSKSLRTVIVQLAAAAGGSVGREVVDADVLYYSALDERRVECLLLVTHLTVLEREVLQGILIRLAYVKEIGTVNVDATDGDVVALRERHVGTVAWLEELCPWTYHKE